MNSIEVIGARQHNLKNVSVEVPREKVVVFTGVSGSGKSSLVFDTICAEAQRQLIETFGYFARRRLPKISRPSVDDIRNLSTAIVIDQKRMGTTLASTVGTATEIYAHLRLLFSRVGEPSIGPSHLFSFNLPQGMCPRCGGLGNELVIDVDRLLDRSRSVEQGAVLHPDYRPGTYFWKQLMNCGFFDPRKPVEAFTADELFGLLYKEQCKFRNTRFGEEYNSTYEGVVNKLKRRYLNREEGSEGPTPLAAYRTCPECGGSRINAAARGVKVNGKTIPELVRMELPALLEWMDVLEGPVAEPITRRMKATVQCLIDIGVGYLSLDRPVATLSGGESQRVKMARQLDCNLVGLIYVLDEPTAGLHPRDVGQLMTVVRGLRDKGNSVLVVEHDPAVIEQADHVVDMGPGAGAKGGEVLYSGPVDGLRAAGTLTSRCLQRRTAVRRPRRRPTGSYPVRGATAHNLKGVDVDIPKGVFVCVTGVAGSGKSSLVGVFCDQHPEAIVVDQGAIGRSSRSNALSYVGVFDRVRREFARATGKSASLFSFNSEGACPKCNGSGIVKVEMNFLDDVAVVCDQCDGRRYSEEVLALAYKGKSIVDVMDMTVDEAVDFFDDTEVARKLEVLASVGLGYLRLGQSLNTLSGGEAQRIKLAAELHKRGNIYVMDEPTSGLHLADTERLLGIIDRLVEEGNSVIVIEHNLDVVAAADWVIDLGPEGGSGGGRIIAQGTPEQVAAEVSSHTGRYLRELLSSKP